MKNLSTYYCAAMAALLLFSAGEITAQEIKLDAGAVANLQFQYAKASSQNVREIVRASGTVRLNEKRVFEITPRIDGVILTDPLSLGDTVEKGDVLCRLQSAELAEMISFYVTAEEAMTFAVASAEQERKLAEKNLSSSEQVREKELALVQSIAAHAKALQPLKLLDFNEATIHQFLSKGDNSDYTSLDISSPASGEIIAKELRRGAAITHDHSLFTIAELSDLWVDFYVALRDAAVFELGDKVVVESSVTDKKGEAEIFYISPVADEQSRTVMIRALLKNENREWRPGTPVNIASRQSSRKSAQLSVPTGAVVDFDGGKAVFVRTGETSFLPVAVKAGGSDGVMIEILEGLEPGQTVVSQNAAQLKGHLEMTSGE